MPLLLFHLPPLLRNEVVNRPQQTAQVASAIGQQMTLPLPGLCFSGPQPLQQRPGAAFLASCWDGEADLKAEVERLMPRTLPRLLQSLLPQQAQLLLVPPPPLVLLQTLQWKSLPPCKLHCLSLPVHPLIQLQLLTRTSSLATTPTMLQLATLAQSAPPLLLLLPPPPHPPPPFPTSLCLLPPALS